MANPILKKEEELPENLLDLLGKKFNPTEHVDIVYIPGIVNMQSLAKIPYFLFAVMSSIVGICFLFTGISEIIHWSKNTRFRNEGMVITFIMFALLFGFFLICRSYLRKSTILQQQIESGEKKFGLWITPTHLLNNDLNEGLRCVAKKDIEHLEVYYSGRPQLNMVLVYLHNKQVVRIVADWLNGYYKKSDELKTLIESKLGSEKIKIEIIDEFFSSHDMPDKKNKRFSLLIQFAEKYNKTHSLSLSEKQEFVTYVNQKIEQWLPEERLAEEGWWVDFNSDDSYQYGVNTAAFMEFMGYYKDPYWLMPLAKTAILDFEMADLIAQRNVDAFIEANCFSGLENLILKIMITDDCVEKIIGSGKFSHLKKLVTPSIHFGNKLVEKKFEAWKNEHRIQSV